MNQTNRQFRLSLLAGVLLAFLSGGAAQAVNVINLTGFWQDDNGNFIEVERNGPDAVAIMRSPQGRSNWMRGSMKLSGDILLVKKKGTRTVGSVRGELVRGIGNTRIRWNSGRVWRKSSLSAYNASLRQHDHGYGHDHYHGHPDAVTLAHLQGRWQSSDDTVIDIRQDGHSLSVRVISRHGGGRSHSHHPWSTGHGRISDSGLSLDCYHGTSLAERVTGRYVPATSSVKAHISWSNGKTWYQRPDHFRVITEPVGAVGRLPVEVIDTVIPSRASSVWQYASGGGYFHRRDNNRWHEYGTDGQLRYQYRETHRTDISVTLQDDRRGISVYRKKDECWFRQRGSDDWRRLSAGHWSSRPPGSSRPPSYRSHGQGRYGQSRSTPPPYSGRGEPVDIGAGIGSLLQGLFGGK